MPESPMLSHCSSKSLFKNLIYPYILIREIYESVSVTALAVTSNFDSGERCRCVRTIP